MTRPVELRSIVFNCVNSKCANLRVHIFLMCGLPWDIFEKGVADYMNQNIENQ